MKMLCIPVNTPPVTLHYGFATHHPRAKEEGTKDPLSYVLTTASDTTVISKLKVQLDKSQVSSQVSAYTLFLKLMGIDDFPGGAVVKNLPANAGDMGPIPE